MCCRSHYCYCIYDNRSMAILYNNIHPNRPTNHHLDLQQLHNQRPDSDFHLRRESRRECLRLILLRCLGDMRQRRLCGRRLLRRSTHSNSHPSRAAHEQWRRNSDGVRKHDGALHRSRLDQRHHDYFQGEQQRRWSERRRHCRYCGWHRCGSLPLAAAMRLFVYSWRCR